MARLAILTPLRHPKYRLLFAGQAISDLGDWMSFLALITIITYHWQMGPAALAALSIMLILPALLVAPFAGVLVDRWPKRRVMITCDLLRALLVGGLIFAPELFSTLTLVFLIGAVGSFFGPARQGALVYTVPKEDLLQANALSQLSVQSAKVLGPSIGGVLVAVFSPQLAYLVDALSYLASAIILSGLPPLLLEGHAEQSADSGKPAKPSFWQEFKVGITYLFKKRALATAVVSLTAAMFIIFTFDALGSLAMKELKVGEEVLGFAVGAIGLGTVIGAILIGQYGRKFNPLSIMAFGNVCGGIAVSLMGAAVLLRLNGVGLALLPLWLFIGLTGAAMFVPYGYILQSETPRELIGRVGATAGAIQTTFQLLAPPLGALLASLFGIGFVFTLAGGGLALLGLLMLFLPKRKSSPSNQNSSLQPEIAEAEARVS